MPSVQGPVQMGRNCRYQTELLRGVGGPSSLQKRIEKVSSSVGGVQSVSVLTQRREENWLLSS